jgi:hypothetical protein
MLTDEQLAAIAAAYDARPSAAIYGAPDDNRAVNETDTAFTAARVWWYVGVLLEEVKRLRAPKPRYPNTGRFVVVRNDGAYTADDRDPVTRSLDGWTSDRTRARVYKLRIWAERAAARWGGIVRQEG